MSVDSGPRELRVHLSWGGEWQFTRFKISVAASLSDTFMCTIPHLLVKEQARHWSSHKCSRSRGPSDPVSHVTIVLSIAVLSKNASPAVCEELLYPKWPVYFILLRYKCVCVYSISKTPLIHSAELAYIHMKPEANFWGLLATKRVSNIHQAATSEFCDVLWPCSVSSLHNPHS